MADFNGIIQEINEEIKTNGKKSISGSVLNQLLNDLIDAVNQLKQDALTFYSEDVQDDAASIESPSLLNLTGIERVKIKTAGNHITILEEGNSVFIGSNTDKYYIKINTDKLEIKTNYGLNTISMDDTGFHVELMDGDDPYTLSFDVYNGLTFGETNILQILESLQEQINELKGS